MSYEVLFLLSLLSTIMTNEVVPSKCKGGIILSHYPLVTLSDWESFFALQCPGVLLSTPVSLPTHYIQVLDNTWVPCDIQMANFPLFRQFAALTHLREVYVCAIQASESQTERRAVRLSLFSSQKCFMKHLFLFCWFCFCLSSNNSISVAQMIITWCRTPAWGLRFIWGPSF